MVDKTAELSQMVNISDFVNQAAKSRILCRYLKSGKSTNLTHLFMGKNQHKY